MGRVNVSAVRWLGGLGVIFFLAGLLPYVGFIFNLLGMLLIGLANRYLAKLYRDNSIFSNTLWGLLVGFVVPFVGLLLYTAAAAKPNPSPVEALLAFGISYVGFVISGYFFYKVYTRLAELSGVKIFRWGAYLILGGYLALPLFGIGGVVAIAGWTLVMVGYFSLPENSGGEKSPEGA